MIEVKINGIKCRVEKGTKIFKAASMNCFNIPTLCNKPNNQDSINTRCGVCVVEVLVNGKSQLVPSCCTDVEEGMVITTLSQNVVNLRKKNVQSLRIW